MDRPDPGVGSGGGATTRLRLERYHAGLSAGVEAFSSRLTRGGVRPDFRFGSGPPVVPDTSAPIWSETLLAVDEEGEVRGGVILHHQRFHTSAGALPVVNLQLPLSEGLVDRRFAFVGMWLIRTIQRMHPYAFAVGMGGEDQPLPMLLRALRWSVTTVPFQFQVVHARNFLRDLPALRTSRSRRLVSNVAAYAGAGAILSAHRALAYVRSRAGHPLTAERVHEWGAWADHIWDHVRPSLALASWRDGAALARLYPPGEERYSCFRLNDGVRAVGWAVILRKEMRDSSQMGNLRVATVLDLLVEHGYEGRAARLSAGLARETDVDVIITNMQNSKLHESFRRAAFLTGPSNFVLALSPALARSSGVGATDVEALRTAHVTRGDGDGRINL